MHLIDDDRPLAEGLHHLPMETAATAPFDEGSKVRWGGVAVGEMMVGDDENIYQRINFSDRFCFMIVFL